MVQTKKKVMIIGASGNLGPSMLSAFDNPSFDVSVLTRKSSKTSFPSYVKIYHISDDYPEDELIGAFTSQDAIVNMAPITAVATHKAIIDAAIKAKVSRIVLSEFGTNVPELQTTEPVPIYQGKIEIREYMKSRESSELTWTGLVVGAFLDWGLRDGFLGFDLKTKTATIFGSGDTPCNFSLLSTTAKATVAILEKPTETANRYVFINSFHCTQKEILSALETTTGGQKWKVVKGSCVEESDLGGRLMASGDWSGVGHAIMGASYTGGKYDFSLGRVLDNGLLGLKAPNSLESVVRRIVDGETIE